MTVLTNCPLFCCKSILRVGEGVSGGNLVFICDYGHCFIVYSVNTFTVYDNMIPRTLQSEIEGKLFKGKAIIVLGARQTGKTTLLKKIADLHDPYTFLNCDEPIVREREFLLR